MSTDVQETSNLVDKSMEFDTAGENEDSYVIGEDGDFSLILADGVNSFTRSSNVLVTSRRHSRLLNWQCTSCFDSNFPEQQHILPAPAPQSGEADERLAEDDSELSLSVVIDVSQGVSYITTHYTVDTQPTDANIASPAQVHSLSSRMDFFTIGPPLVTLIIAIVYLMFRKGRHSNNIRAIPSVVTEDISVAISTSLSEVNTTHANEEDHMQSIVNSTEDSIAVITETDSPISDVQQLDNNTNHSEEQDKQASILLPTITNVIVGVEQNLEGIDKEVDDMCLWNIYPHSRHGQTHSTPPANTTPSATVHNIPINTTSSLPTSAAKGTESASDTSQSSRSPALSPTLNPLLMLSPTKDATNANNVAAANLLAVSVDSDEEDSRPAEKVAATNNAIDFSDIYSAAEERDTSLLSTDPQTLLHDLIDDAEQEPDNAENHETSFAEIYEENDDLMQESSHMADDLPYFHQQHNLQFSHNYDNHNRKNTNLYCSTDAEDNGHSNSSKEGEEEEEEEDMLSPLSSCDPYDTMSRTKTMYSPQQKSILSQSQTLSMSQSPVRTAKQVVLETEMTATPLTATPMSTSSASASASEGNSPTNTNDNNNIDDNNKQWGEKNILSPMPPTNNTLTATTTTSSQPIPESVSFPETVPVPQSASVPESVSAMSPAAAAAAAAAAVVPMTPPRSAGGRRLVLSPLSPSKHTAGFTPSAPPTPNRVIPLAPQTATMTPPRCYPTRPTQSPAQVQHFRRTYDLCFPRQSPLQPTVSASQSPVAAVATSKPLSEEVVVKNVAVENDVEREVRKEVVVVQQQPQQQQQKEDELVEEGDSDDEDPIEEEEDEEDNISDEEEEERDIEEDDERTVVTAYASTSKNTSNKSSGVARQPAYALKKRSQAERALISIISPVPVVTDSLIKDNTNTKTASAKKKSSAKTPAAVGKEGNKFSSPSLTSAVQGKMVQERIRLFEQH